MMIPMLNLPRVHASMGEDLPRALDAVIASAAFLPNHFTPEPATPFERKLAAYTGRRFAIGVGSGTAAIHLALLAAGVRPGDEVITVPNSFFATTEAALLCGARPVFVDVDPDSHQEDPRQISTALSPRTRAVLVVHLYGNVSDTDAVAAALASAGRSDVRIIEDCAHAIGAWRGHTSVPIAGLGAFSFNPVKNIGGLSDGGAIVTDDEAVAAAARLLSNHGRADKNHHTVVGFNSRLSLINDAVLSLKLDHLDAWNDRRRLIAARYDEAFAGLGDLRPVRVQATVRAAFYQYVVATARRDQLRRRLEDEGVATAIHYPMLIPSQPSLRALGYATDTLPQATALNRRILSLPVYAELTDDEVSRVIALVRAFFEG